MEDQNGSFNNSNCLSSGSSSPFELLETPESHQKADVESQTPFYDSHNHESGCNESASNRSIELTR